MHNYYNILPTILIDVLIILIFEGLLFFLYLEKQQEKIISTQLLDFLDKLHIAKSEQDNSAKQILKVITEIANPYVKTSMNDEKEYNEKQYKLGIIIYSSILLGIIISLIVYSYVVVRIYGKTIDWSIVIITVVITILLIILLEMLYVKYVLFNKKFNESQIKLDFINAIRD